MSSSMPWFKVWNEMPRDFKLDSLSIQLNKSRMELLGAWITILSLASESPERGKLLVTRDTTVTSASLSRLLDWNVTDTELLLNELIHHGMLSDLDKTVYSVVNWNKRQDPIDKTGAKRKQMQRERNATRDVTRDEVQMSRVEDRGQRIEDRFKEQKKKETTPAFSIPDQLNTSEFLKAWNGWLAYRSEIKHKITKSTAEKQLKKLSTYPINTAIKMLEQSIENGWQGLFEIKSSGGQRKSTYQETINECARKRGINLDEFQILKPEGEIIDV